MPNSTAKATRPYFIANPEAKQGEQIFREYEIEFEWHRGMSWQVRQRSSDSMAEEIIKQYPKCEGKILEVSTKSHNFELGQGLSAFNLKLGKYPIENWFQSAKVTEKGGPYLDLLTVDPKIAKRDPRFIKDQKTNGDPKSYHKLLGFRGVDRLYPLEPKSAFYDFIYCKALVDPQNDSLRNEIIKYDIFTDIEFNPEPRGTKIRRYNTQSRACAIFVALEKRGTLSSVISDFDNFVVEVGYVVDGNHAQQSLIPDFDSRS